MFQNSRQKHTEKLQNKKSWVITFVSLFLTNGIYSEVYI